MCIRDRAASDHLVRAWGHTYKIPFIITNCSNNFGPYQHEEKFIPKIIKNALKWSKIPIYGEGKNVRDWIFVDDHCKALIKIIENGHVGETYNIGTGEEVTNINLAKLICRKLDVICPNQNDSYESLISFVKDEVNILSNESSQIIRLLNSIKIQSKYQILTIKDCNQKFLDLINNRINDGVYKCGFARNQLAYENASQNLFAAINEVEKFLQKNKGDWIFGEELTYADIYLFPTLIRWELIYSKLFKCTEQELSSFEKIIEWRLKFFKLSNVNRTCFDNEWKKDYYKALFPLNPNQLIPVLPSLEEIMRLES